MRIPRLEKHLRWLNIKLLQKIHGAVIFQEAKLKVSLI